jgi:hypothetical protein
VNAVPPADSPNLSYSFVNYTELGKSVFLFGFRSKQTVRNANGMRIWECRKSECFSVMEKIEIETLSHVKTGRLLQGLSLRENEGSLNSESKRSFVYDKICV